MQVTSKTGPLAPPSIPTAQANPVQSARERAIARLIEGGNQVQATPVSNPSSVSPEELGALKGQNSKVEAPQAAATEVATDPNPAPEAPKAPVRDEQLSAHYAQLARKEKALRAQQAAIKAEKDAIKAQQDAFAIKEAEYQSKYISKDKLTQDTFNALMEAGVSFDQLAALMANPPKPEDQARSAEMKQLEADIKTLKTQQEEVKKRMEDQQTQAYQQALAQIRSEVQSLVDKDPSFETIKATRSVRDVVELIEKTFNEDGILLTPEDAAQEVEDYLVDEAAKLAKLSKIQKRLAPASQSAQPNNPPAKQSGVAGQSAPKQPSPQSRTITNAISTGRQLSARERAVLAFEGKLSK